MRAPSLFLSLETVISASLIALLKIFATETSLSEINNLFLVECE